MKTYPVIKILGVDFINANLEEVIDIIKKGGLLGAPAAPGLLKIKKDPEYHKSLLFADVIIPDSGFMVLLWNAFHREKINRISGLKFLMTFLKDQEIKDSSSLLLVDPNPAEAQHNINYLKNSGFNISNDISYVAPIYNKNYIEDGFLLNAIELKKPKYIIINLGGGTQEKLGAYLKENLTYKPAIICTGAAIAFITGQQARIPAWGDKLYLGWLFRCVQNPKVYVPRYIEAFKLAAYMFNYSYRPFLKITRIYKKAASSTYIK